MIWWLATTFVNSSIIALLLKGAHLINSRWQQIAQLCELAGLLLDDIASIICYNQPVMAAESDGFIYFPDPRREHARRTMGGFLIIAGGGLGCLFLVIGLLVGPLYSANVAQDPLAEVIPGYLFPCLALVFGLGSAGLGVWLIRRPHRGWLELTEDELVLISGRQSTALRLVDIERLSIVPKDSQTGRVPSGLGSWLVHIEDRADQAINLAIGEPGHLATYDVVPILRDLLPRLPATTVVDDQVFHFLETGRVTDKDEEQ